MALHASQTLPPASGVTGGGMVLSPMALSRGFDRRPSGHRSSPHTCWRRWPGDVPSLGIISCLYCWRESCSLAGLVVCTTGALLLSLCPVSPEDKPETVVFDPHHCAPRGCMHTVLGWSSRSRKLTAAKNSASCHSWLLSENPREYVGPVPPLGPLSCWYKYKHQVPPPCKVPHI